MKRPRTRQSTGAAEQLSFIPEPPFCPIFPNVHSAAGQVLLALLDGPTTQLDWLALGKGWRLAAAVKELDYLGWPVDSVLLKRQGWPRPIAVYSLPPKAKQAAVLMREVSGHAIH